MVRALILLAAAIAVALLPGPRLLRGIAVVILVAAAAAVGYFAEYQIVERSVEDQARLSAEEARWTPPPSPETMRIVSWNATAPLRFSDFWAVDGTAGLQSPRASEITGVEITVAAYDCPAADTPLTACVALGESTTRATFNPVGPQNVRQTRLRYRFDEAPRPEAVLRLIPNVTAIRI